jgi:hypothetical protein
LIMDIRQVREALTRLLGSSAEPRGVLVGLASHVGLHLESWWRRSLQLSMPVTRASGRKPQRESNNLFSLDIMRRRRKSPLN